MEKILSALDDTNNDKLLTTTTAKIRALTLKLLRELPLSPEIVAQYAEKLADYKFVDEINDVKAGTFLRWISLDGDNLYLHAGGIIREVKVTKNGLMMVCKNFGGRHYQIKMDNCLIFQKLTTQEKILLSALDHLAK